LSLQDCGYVQTMDYDKLAECARQADALVVLDFRPGQFLMPHGQHGRIFPPSADDEWLQKKVTDNIAVGGQRTPEQDLEFAVRQLVELALRALSPSLNDPFTAVAVIGRLGLFLAEVMRRGPAPSVWYDKEGKPRII